MILIVVDLVVRNSSQRPGNESAVAVLTVNMGVDIFGADMETSCQFRLQAAGIQNSSGAKNTVFRNAGNFGEHIGQNIHRIRHDDVDGIRCVFYDFRGNIFQDVYICLGKFQSGLTGLSGNTGGNDDDLRACGILVIAGADDGRGAEGSTLINIQCFTHGFFFVHINEHHFAGNALYHNVVCDGRAYTTGTDYCDLG